MTVMSEGVCTVGVKKVLAPVKQSGHSPSDLREAVKGVRGDVLFNESLAPYTSFRIGGPADVYVIPEDAEALGQLVVQARGLRIPLFVLGGTNVLIRDGGLRGVVVGLSKLHEIRDEGQGVLYAEAGVGMPTLLKNAVSRSLSGLEWAAGIPGTVGGCLVMNAGTKLGEMSSAVKGVRIVDSKGAIQDYPASDLHFTYRRTHVPAGIVVGVWLQLEPGSRETIGMEVKNYLKYRKETQPLSLPSAGCVFINPEPQSAGQLIEEVGMKGARIGDAQVSEKHANFMVNQGQATADDVLALIKQVGKAVEQQKGVTLQLELKIIGSP